MSAKLINGSGKITTPKKIYLVIQEGGSSGELYIHAHNTLKGAETDMKVCEDASYRSAGPVEIPETLTKSLLLNSEAEQSFYSVVEKTVRAAASLR